MVTIFFCETAAKIRRNDSIASDIRIAIDGVINFQIAQQMKDCVRIDCVRCCVHDVDDGLNRYRVMQAERLRVIIVVWTLAYRTLGYAAVTAYPDVRMLASSR